MAYTKGNYQAKTTPTAIHTGSKHMNAAASKQEKVTVFSTGLFKPTKEGVKSLGSIQLKESITLPAGSYINLYEVDDTSRFKNPDNAPAFTLKVTEGKLKAD